MSLFYKASIKNEKVVIDKAHKIEKADAAKRIKSGENVWGSKKNAHTLAESLCDGQGNMKHSPHVIGGYKHYHDVNHNYSGHIFYGEPGEPKK